MTRPSRWLPALAALLCVLAFAYTAHTAATNAVQALPELDKDSIKGLTLHAALVKEKFAVGEPVNVWCTVTNTTDAIKPLAWHPSSGHNFVMTRDGTPPHSGLLPLVIPHIEQPLTIKSQSGPGYILYLPPHASVQLLLTHKPDRPEKFHGLVAYDPVPEGGKIVAATEKAEDGCISNQFGYEVTAAADQ